MPPKRLTRYAVSGDARWESADGKRYLMRQLPSTTIDAYDAVEAKHHAGMYYLVANSFLGEPEWTLIVGVEELEYVESTARGSVAQCECCDPGCPAHLHADGCDALAVSILCRVDMGYDDEGMAFCEACASDALEAGFLTHEGDL